MTGTGKMNPFFAGNRNAITAINQDLETLENSNWNGPSLELWRNDSGITNQGALRTLIRLLPSNSGLNETDDGKTLEPLYWRVSCQSIINQCKGTRVSTRHHINNTRSRVLDVISPIGRTPLLHCADGQGHTTTHTAWKHLQRQV